MDEVLDIALQAPIGKAVTFGVASKRRKAVKKSS